MVRSDDVEKTNGPLVIYVGRQHDGAVYELGPLSEIRMEDNYPHVQRLPDVMLGYEQKQDFERLHGPLWGQVALMLTGLTPEQVNNLGGVRLYEPRTQTEWDIKLTSRR
jgi:hypothetical protein